MSKAKKNPWSHGRLFSATVTPNNRPYWKRFDAREGLTLHDAMIYYGPDLEAETVYQLELEGYGGPPPMLDVSGWPNEEEEKDFRIKSFRLREHTQVLQQKLLIKLKSGDLYATGYTAGSPLDQAAARIATDRWRILKPDFDNSEATGTGDKIVGILVFQPVSVRRPKQGRFSEANLQSWYREWISKNLQAGKIPSRDDDWAAAKADFSSKIPRDRLRALRKEYAPADWKRFGRRKRRHPEDE